MKKNLIIFWLIILVFVAGFIMGSSYGNSNNYNTWWEDAKKRVLETGFIPLMSKMKNIYGEVKEVRGNNIILKMKVMDPFADKNLDERIVEVGSSTRIVTMKNVGNDVIYWTGWWITGTGSKEDLTMDSLTDIKNIKVGSFLDITSVDDDIKDKKSFKALEIRIHPNN